MTNPAIALPRKGETYQHYKGTNYLVLGIQKDSETLRLRVSYTDGEIEWSRLCHGTDPETGVAFGWCDPLPDGRPRFVKVS